MPAVMWRREPVEMQQERTSLSVEMHRAAGKLGFSCMPKLSSIDRRWFAEINEIELRPDGSYKSTRFNVKLGTGDTPLEAAANGYAQASPEMAMYPVLAGLEAVLPQIAKRAETLRKIDATLDGLTAALRSVNVPRAADPGEDDDL